MKIKELNKAVLAAVVKILLSVVFVYVTIGCILFPEWWKEFVFLGGLLKGHFWRDALNVLGAHFKSFSPLAISMLFAFCSLIGYAIYWFGRSANQSDSSKIAFIVRLAPRRSLLLILAVFCGLALGAATLQPGSYSTNKETERLNRMLDDRMDALERRERDPFVPPSSGVYLYVNEKLVLEQFEALRSGLEIKSVVESLASEKNASASISLPLHAGSVEASAKSAAEKTVTKTAPETSPAIALQGLSDRFRASTNVFKLTPLSYFAQTTEYFLGQLQERGVELTQDQLAKLKEADKLAFDKIVQTIEPRQVFLCQGTILVRASGDSMTFEVTYDQAATKIHVTGTLQKRWMRDQMLFTAGEGKGDTKFTLASMLTLVQKVERDASNNLVLTLIPYAMW